MSVHTIPLETITESLFDEKGVSVSVLRLDMIHPVISGNKWFKLKYNIEAFLKEKKEFLVTVGGAYSNHIVATAAAGKEYVIQTVGIIRGEELNENSNAALKFASACGMKLFFVTRDDYRIIRETEIIPPWIYSHLPSPLSSSFFLPEGGSNILAVKGCEEIVKNIPEDFDYIICAVGTGTTLAGISNSLTADQTVIGIPVLEGKNFLEETISTFNGGRKNFKLFHEYSFGGYANSNNELDLFCKNFSQKHEIAIEPIYTSKMFYGLYDLIKKDFFKTNSSIVAIHTGGTGNSRHFSRLRTEPR
jgi:1-aminocyclopropane-1-carboxylate deaminase